MRFLAAASAVFLFLFLAFSTPAFSQEDKDRAAQQEDKSKDKDKDKDKDKEQNKNDKNREQPRRDNPDARQENHDAQQQNRDRENRDRNNNAMRQQEEQREQRPVEHADQHSVQGRRVERIPDDRFRASFGREHHFHVDRDRVYSQPQPVVVYGGYSFQLVDAWPRDWSFDDDCYVDYYDGQYWLYDANRPGMRIAVVVLEGY